MILVFHVFPAATVRECGHHEIPHYSGHDGNHGPRDGARQLADGDKRPEHQNRNQPAAHRGQSIPPRTGQP